MCSNLCTYGNSGCNDGSAGPACLLAPKRVNSRQFCPPTPKPSSAVTPLGDAVFPSQAECAGPAAGAWQPAEQAVRLRPAARVSTLGRPGARPVCAAPLLAVRPGAPAPCRAFSPLVPAPCLRQRSGGSSVLPSAGRPALFACGRRHFVKKGGEGGSAAGR